MMSGITFLFIILLFIYIVNGNSQLNIHIQNILRMKINYKISDNNNRLFKYNCKNEQKIIKSNTKKEIRNSKKKSKIFQNDNKNKNSFNKKKNINFVNKKKIKNFPPKKKKNSIKSIISISLKSLNKKSIYYPISLSSKSLKIKKNKENLLELKKNKKKSLNNNNKKSKRSKEKSIKNKKIKNIKMYLDKYKIEDLNDEEMNMN